MAGALFLNALISLPQQVAGLIWKKSEPSLIITKCRAKLKVILSENYCICLCINWNYKPKARKRVLFPSSHGGTSSVLLCLEVCIETPVKDYHQNGVKIPQAVKG